MRFEFANSTRYFTMPRQRSPRRHSRSPRRQRDRRHRSSSSRSRSRSRGHTNRSPIGSKFNKERQYSRNSLPPKVRRHSRRSPSPPPPKHGGRRSRSYSPHYHAQPSTTTYDGRSRSPGRGFQDRTLGRGDHDQSADYYQKVKDHSHLPHSDAQHMRTYTVVNRDRSYTPERRPGNERQDYDDRRDEPPRDLDARLREMEARSSEIAKPRVYVKDDYSHNSPMDQFGQSSSYDKGRPDRSPDEKYNRESRSYKENLQKDSYNDNYQTNRDYSPPRHESREHRRNSRKSKDAKYAGSPNRYHSPEPENRRYRDDEHDNHDRSREDEPKYREKKNHDKERNNHGSTSRDAFDSSQKSHRRQDSTHNKSRPDRELEREHRAPSFDPTLVVVPRRKDEGRGGIFNRPEITMRSISDDPDHQSMPLEEKRVVAVLPGKRLPDLPSSDRDLRRDYIELLARKGVSANEFEVRRDKYGDVGITAPGTMSSRFQGASSLDFLTTLENLEINRTKNLERELELRREMDYLRERSPLRLSETHADLEERLNMIERKVEPKPRDLRHDLESRRKQLKAERNDGRVETPISPRRFIVKKRDKDSKMRMTSVDRRPVRERLGLSPSKKERRSLDRHEVHEQEVMPDFKKEVQELQKAEWMADPKSVPKGIGYFEHDDRERDVGFPGRFTRGRGIRGRGLGFRGRFLSRGRGFIRGSFRGSFRGRGGFSNRGFRGLRRGWGTTSFRGRGLTSFRGRGRSSPSWKHDKFEGESKERTAEKAEKRGVVGKVKDSKRDSSGSRADDRHASRKDDRKTQSSNKRSSTKQRDSSSSRVRESRESRKDRR